MDSALPLQGAWVQSLVRELRPPQVVWHGQKKTVKTKILKENTDLTVLNFKTSLWLKQTKPNIKQRN